MNARLGWRRGRVFLLALWAAVGLPRAGGARAEDPPAAQAEFEAALKAAEQALAAGRKDEAHALVLGALERDARSPLAWQGMAAWAQAAGDADELAYARHRVLELLVAQKGPPAEIKAARAALEAADPNAKRLLELRGAFVERLTTLAKAYEKAKRPHAAIRVWQEVRGLDAEHPEASLAIERISAAPDPSLAETARAKDPLGEVSAAWISKHDAQHATWEKRSTLERPNYVTHTDAGYAVMVRAAEAMEQMNGFYRQFFRYGTEDDARQVPRIELRIFKDRDEYLKLGSNPPEWSGGQFTGGAVEVYVAGSFEAMVPTLFHEAAHQFIGMATQASGWLNEGLACFFEGCRIQSNGTVLVNLPANERLFALAGRMAAGWMSDAKDGIDPAEPSKSNPPKAPTFRIVLENEYEWGPCWYAPTWGVVYFLHNLQDPSDGRYLYRQGLRTFLDTSGGRVGRGAIKNFEETVLAAPAPPTKGVAQAKAGAAALPKTVDALDEVWKTWILALRDQQSGKAVAERPWLDWARHAVARKDLADATEFFEKGLVALPRDPDLLAEFAEHLATRLKNPDRAVKLALRALAELEAAKQPDAARIQALEKRLAAWDPKHVSLAEVHERLHVQARQVVEKYLAQQRWLMAMHVSRRLASELRIPGMAALYEQAARRAARPLALWQLAYNERDLAGWAAEASTAFQPYGSVLNARWGTYVKGRYDYTFLTLDQVAPGDFSLEAEVRVEQDKGALAGLVFGRKDRSNFHALVLWPEGYADLASLYGGEYKVWRHESIPPAAEGWRRLRLDVSDRFVDVWCDGTLVTTQEFPSQDVLRGSFGLLTGPGEATFRRVRYLARDPQDPSAAVERAVRLEQAAQGGPAKTGSYVGHTPPWPQPAAWLQAERSSWSEKGPVPTLLVLWSVAQNEALPLHAWLAHLTKEHADVGLEVVCVCEAGPAERVKAHLATCPFPGAVCLDFLDLSQPGVGRTMDAYFIGKRFQFPRVLLLDVDQRVVWEGNPGFEFGVPWKPGTASYLDTPLQELIARRDLKRSAPWRREWLAQGLPALERGDLAAAAPLLARAAGLPEASFPEVAWARDLHAGLARALAEPDATAKDFAAAGAEPAWADLLALAAPLGLPAPDAKRVKALQKHLTSPNAKAWATALAAARKPLSLPPADLEGRPRAQAAAVGEIQPLPGALPALLLERLAAAADDPEARHAVLADAARIPAHWLIRRYAP